MTDNCDDKCEIVNVKEADNVDSDKSFESCVNSVVDGISNALIKDDDSERSFQSCSNINQDKTEDSDKKENVEPINSSYVDEDEDDDIRPGSCRENPSSDDETSSWDENKDNWIYDTEYLKEAESKTQLPEAEATELDLNLCKEDLEYIIENHVTKDIDELNEINNPTFIPTNGKFYMHDLRLEDSTDEVIKTNKNQKNFPSKSNETWKHDLYDESRQKPISQGELINKYGADIRQKNDFQENKFKKPYRTNNIKRYNYRPQYYDYEYYDKYDYGYYYSSDGYYDYNYYGAQYNSWNRNRYRNYKSNSPDIKPKKSSKPPSKYSQISEYTDIKITVNLDNLGTRQIENIGNNSNRSYHSKTYENSNNFNHRRLDGFSTDENIDFVEPCNHSTPKKDQGEIDSINTNNNSRKSLPDLQKKNNYYDSNNKGGNYNKNQGENRKPGNVAPTKRNNNNYPPPQFQRNFTKSSQNKFTTNQSNYHHQTEYERTQGKPSQLSYRQRQNVPDWANTKFEWDANCDFKDVIEEMPPLTEKEINQLQKRPTNPHNNPPPPRFSREKSSSAPQSDNNNKTNQNNRTNQTFVPKRYSEFRNQSEQTPPAPQHHHHQQQQQQQSHIDPTNQHPQAQPQPHQIINYQQMMPSLEYYNNLQPLLLNINQHPNSAPANSPQQSSNTFSSIHHPHAAPPPHVPAPPHMVSLSSLLQSGTTGTGGFDNNNQQQQFYIHPLYLPTAAAAAVTRLNQFSQPFQPSYVSQTTSQTPLYPAHSSSAPSTSTAAPTSSISTSCNTPNVSQSSRPVLGRS